MSDLSNARPESNALQEEDSILGQIADEFLQRLNGGEEARIEEYLERYPHLAAVLGQVLPALQAIRHYPPQAVEAGNGSSGEGPVSSTLGDFRIFQEIGRGGMGIVYEAEQISLGRRVALKVLPFAAAMDPRQLQRFKNEAQAAAHLQHTNIVPVHYVGCERGVHFYAMQFIEGQTLAAIIRELRALVGLENGRPAASEAANSLASELASGQWAPPQGQSADELVHPRGFEPPTGPYPVAAHLTTSLPHDPTSAVAALSTQRSTKNPGFFRTVAHLGVQAAEALEHAHLAGIIHRDIKPGNLLVDAGGGLWITDFGLAKLGSTAGLTMTGDLVGTLRYMSPEQALAKRVTVDARTDVYSLGVTLYELLALEPAYNGRNREDVLRQIAFEEPRPPSRWNKSVPAELETIVLKASAKNPGERYATAQELADDLRRFLEDKPIKAKRPTLSQRAVKWARRHKTVVRAAGVVMVLAVVALGVSTLLIWQQSKMTKAAKIEADENLDTAFGLLNDFYLDLAERRLPQQQTLAPEDRLLLEKALKAYEQFARRRGTERRVRRQTALAYLRLASIQEQLGQYTQAKEKYFQAREFFAGLAAEFPNEPECCHNLARCLSAMADFIHPRYFDTIQQNEEALLHALELQKGLASEFPENANYQRELGQSYARMGFRFYQTGRMEQAEKLLRAGLAVRDKLAKDHPTPDHRQDLGDSLGRLGCVFEAAGQFEETEKLFRRGLDIRKKIVEDFPSLPIHRYYLGFPYFEFGRLLQETGRLQEAEENLRQSVAIFRKVAEEFPGVPVYRLCSGNSMSRLAHLLQQMRRFEEGEQAYREGQDILMSMIREHPAMTLNAFGWGSFEPLPGGEQTSIGLNSFLLAMNAFNWDAYLGRGRAYEHLWEPQKAIADYTIALAMMPPEYEKRGTTLFQRSENYRRLNELSKADADLQTIADFDLQMIADFDLDHHLDAGSVAFQCNNLALRYLTGPQKQGDLNKALSLAQKAIKLSPDNCLCLNTLGLIYYRLGRYQEAREKLERSLRDSKGETAAINLFFLAMCHTRQGNAAKAKGCYERAVYLLAEQQGKLHPSWQKELEVIRAEATSLLQGHAQSTQGE